MLKYDIMISCITLKIVLFQTHRFFKNHLSKIFDVGMKTPVKRVFFMASLQVAHKKI